MHHLPVLSHYLCVKLISPTTPQQSLTMLTYRGSLKKSYSSRDNTVFEVEKPPPEAADDVIHAPMLPPLTFGGKSLRIPVSLACPALAM